MRVPTVHDERMQLIDMPFEVTTWSEVPPTVHPGTSGEARWHTKTFGAMRVRMVEYSPGYLADHWCEKGHVVLCVRGQVRTELSDGRVFELKPGMGYQVGDGQSSHRSQTDHGATLFIVD